ncbi:MAG: hypothetical protein M3Z03_06980 [Actinomycetota bacterium]|nr:hypothetical protein [Actinomycetota bacterium]
MGRTPRRGRFVALALAFAGLAGALQVGGATADTVTAPATVSRQAYFTNPITQVTPPLLRNGFPPATLCLVAGLGGLPQLCGPEVQELGGLLGLSDGLPIPVTPDGDLAQIVALPGTTPVGMLAGQQRYASLFQLALPALPAGERFGSFELILHQSGVNFAIESPAVRDIVLQIVSQLEAQDPQKILDAVTRAISGEVPLVTETITGIEACPALEPWRSGVGQGASLDGTRLPDVECLIGTTGAYDAAAGTFTFDLTFAAQAWTEGIEGEAFNNEGIILRPVGAPNLAYGDPDLSTNWVVSLGDATAAEGLRPEIRYTTVPAPSADTGGDVDLGVGLPDFGTGTGPIDFGAPSTGSTGSAGLSGPFSARYADLADFDGKGSTPGWVWVALPLGALGALLFAQSLSASPAASRRRPGALTRLIAERDPEALS